MPSVTKHEPIHKTEACKMLQQSSVALFVGIDTCTSYIYLAEEVDGNREARILVCYLSCVIEHPSWMFLGVL